MYIHDGSSFYVSDEYGDASGESTEGFFYRDTRFLSKGILRINGQRPLLLRAEQVDYYSASFYLTLPFVTPEASHPLSIIRNRFIGNGVHEEVILENYGENPLEVTLSFLWDCDFADLFEVKSGHVDKPSVPTFLDTALNELTFVYANKGLQRQTVIACDCCPAWIQGRETVLEIRVPSRGQSKTCFNIHPVWELQRKKVKYSCDDFGQAKPEMHETITDWVARTPKLESDCDALNHTFTKSILDLAGLRFFVNLDTSPVLAAGLPWFMALFGRDSLITAYQCCWFVPDLAQAILRTLAHYQGLEVNFFRDEEPGKILHELRFGELTQLGITPHSPYYGSVDATPLFLILLHEVYCWTGDQAFINEMKVPAMKALAWIDNYGDIDGDGLIEYLRRSEKGLDNQCWKDSWNSILFADGTLAKSPISVLEVQGYVYDARMRMSELAVTVWGDERLAIRLRSQAAQIKEKIMACFWLSTRGGYFAVALDKNKCPVDSMTSNMGHLLWSGVVEPDQARIIADHLLDKSLYTGWGIRTLSTSDVGYNPIEYHNGTVWPHDNSLIVEGLWRYGFYLESGQVMADLLAAAMYFGYSLPEAFAGYAREPIGFPVNYPTACQPQAWSVGACFLFVKVMLGLTVDTATGALSSSPHLPSGIRSLNLKNLCLFNKHFDLWVEGGKVSWPNGV